MKKFLFALAFATLGLGSVNAQTTTVEVPSKYTVATNSFWSNWYVFAGVDMTLQNPYGAHFNHVFPDGHSFGANIGAGKWFTPGLGLRLKLNWENGIIENSHNKWAPVYDAGGYAALQGAVQFNLSNMLCGYNPTRFYSFIPYLDAGIIRNFKTDWYGPFVGAGIENDFRLGKVVTLYLDLSYTFSTTWYERGAEWYDIKGYDGRWGNHYMTAELGLKFNLGKSTWDKAVTLDQYNALAAASEDALAKLRADLDRERGINADLRKQLANQPKNTEAQTTKVVGSAATSVFFDLNSTTIKSKKDLVNLEAVATAAKESGARVSVKGSADSKTGSTGWNQKLSEGRANAVVEELVNMGVSRDKIDVNAVGGVLEISPYQLNRRAVVELK